MIRLSLPPLPPSETSAFNKIRAFSPRRAGLFPFRSNVSSRSRSSPLSLTTYFFTEISFAAMIASLASRRRRKRITKPPFASFRDIGLQQDPRLQYPARRALSFPKQRFKPFAFLAAQPHNILLYRNPLTSHDCLPRQSLATKANH